MQLQASIKVGNILPGRNPRGYFDPAEMTALEDSVKSKGVLQAILVRPRDAGRYEIVAGERRWRAARKVFGDEYEIPALVRDLDDGEADEAALIENIQRADMSPTEEAEAAAKILGRCQGDRDEASRRLGWSRTTLDKRLALMNCSERVRRALSERRIQLGHAELLAAVSLSANAPRTSRIVVRRRDDGLSYVEPQSVVMTSVERLTIALGRWVRWLDRRWPVVLRKE
jgi:ParB family chromosome partitioning protein